MLAIVTLLAHTPLVTSSTGRVAVKIGKARKIDDYCVATSPKGCKLKSDVYIQRSAIKTWYSQRVAVSSFLRHLWPLETSSWCSFVSHRKWEPLWFFVTSQKMRFSIGTKSAGHSCVCREPQDMLWNWKSLQVWSITAGHWCKVSQHHLLSNAYDKSLPPSRPGICVFIHFFKFFTSTSLQINTPIGHPQIEHKCPNHSVSFSMHFFFVFQAPPVTLMSSCFAWRKIRILLMADLLKVQTR